MENSIHIDKTAYTLISSGRSLLLKELIILFNSFL